MRPAVFQCQGGVAVHCVAHMRLVASKVNEDASFSRQIASHFIYSPSKCITPLFLVIRLRQGARNYDVLSSTAAVLGSYISLEAVTVAVRSAA